MQQHFRQQLCVLVVVVVAVVVLLGQTQAVLAIPHLQPHPKEIMLVHLLTMAALVAAAQVQ